MGYWMDEKKEERNGTTRGFKRKTSLTMEYTGSYQLTWAFDLARYGKVLGLGTGSRRPPRATGRGTVAERVIVITEAPLRRLTESPGRRVKIC
jgi:hypothetical protein